MILFLYSRSITLATPSAGAATLSSQPTNRRHETGTRHEHSDDNSGNVSSSGGGGRSVRLGKHVRRAGGGVIVKSEDAASTSEENAGEGKQGRPTRNKSDSDPGRTKRRR